MLYDERRMSCHRAQSGCPPPSTPDHALALLVEEHHAEAFIAEGALSGVEVHQDADVTWIVHPGAVWRNAAIMMRFSKSSARDRVAQLMARYRKHRRGVAFWIAPAASPDDLSALLARHGLRCQKHFPAMVRSLRSRPEPQPEVRGLNIRRVESLDEFKSTRIQLSDRRPHPCDRRRWNGSASSHRHVSHG